MLLYAQGSAENYVKEDYKDIMELAFAIYSP